MNDHLVIMAKRPTMGRVKTRLAKDIGNVEAYKFFNNNLKQLMRKLGQTGKFKLHVATTPKAFISDRFWPNYVNVIDQGGGDLGVRMNHVYKQISKQHDARRVIIIGSDIPDIQPKHIGAAFETLGNKKACFGPSGDGGYWLVGQSVTPKIDDLFCNVRWSCEHTLSDSVANVNADDVGYVTQLNDVDDVNDYNEYLQGLR